MEELQVANERIYQFSRTWGKERATEMRKRFRSSFKKRSGKQAFKMRSRVTRKFGDVEKISFTSYRYGFILAHGSKPYTLKGKFEGSQHPGVEGKDWLTPSLAPYQSALADYVASQNANAVVKVLQFK